MSETYIVKLHVFHEIDRNGYTPFSITGTFSKKDTTFIPWLVHALESQGQIKVEEKHNI